MYILTLILKVINKVENNFTKQNVSHLPNTGLNSKINYQKSNYVCTMYWWKKLQLNKICNKTKFVTVYRKDKESLGLRS